MRVTANVRGWILLVLILHLLVHPVVHGFATSSTIRSSASVSLPARGHIDPAGSIDHCDLCRVGQSVTAAPAPSRIELLNPHWIRVRIQAVSYASLQVALNLPSRAPPIL
jgi:hypothetical protein